MVNDINIWRSAKLLVERYGDEAPIHAAMRVDELLDEGDVDGRTVWLRVVRAFEELLNKQPQGVVH